MASLAEPGCCQNESNPDRSATECVSVFVRVSLFLFEPISPTVGEEFPLRLPEIANGWPFRSNISSVSLFWLDSGRGLLVRKHEKPK